MVIKLKNAKRQQGVVLIVALVFLIALTAVAAALMQNTTTDIKMSGASQEKAIVIQETISEIDRVISDQLNPATPNDFTRPAESFDTSLDLTDSLSDSTTGTLDIANQNNLETDCPPIQSASSTDVFTCNILILQVDREYGRNKNSNIVVNAGIAQQLFKKGS